MGLRLEWIVRPGQGPNVVRSVSSFVHYDAYDVFELVAVVVIAEVFLSDHWFPPQRLEKRYAQGNHVIAESQAAFAVAYHRRSASAVCVLDEFLAFHVRFLLEPFFVGNANCLQSSHKGIVLFPTVCTEFPTHGVLLLPIAHRKWLWG